MKDTNGLWSRFEKSGSIADYLEFCNERRREQKAKEAEKPGGTEPQSSV